MNRAFIFPGQGSQAIGMGKDFNDNFKVAQEVFQEVDDTLNYKLSNIMWHGTSEELTLTANTQPALMAVSVAITRVIEELSKKKISHLCSLTAGHSLGEYSALCASSSISLATAANLLKIRGSSMQSAVPEGQGSMAACLGIGKEKLEHLINNVLASDNSNCVCQIANDNIAGQIVISGHKEAVSRVISALKDSGFKAILLKVSAPFHCELMKPAAQAMSDALDKVVISKPAVPVVSNISAKPETDPEAIKTNLIKQVCGSVRWRETLEYFSSAGIAEIVEIGSGRVLTGMLKRVEHNFKLCNVGTIEELEEFLAK